MYARPVSPRESTRPAQVHTSSTFVPQAPLPGSRSPARDHQRSNGYLFHRRWWQYAADLVFSIDHLRLPLALLAGLILVGTGGYHWLLAVSWLDGLYQAVTTLSTVGFHEVKPFDPPTKLFTIALIIFGVGTVFYTLTLLVATVVEGDLRERYGRRIMNRVIQAMERHLVVCGFGRVGEEITREFRERGADFVVIDSAAQSIERAARFGCPTVHGDAADEQILRQAGIDRARCLLVATDSDQTNVYITLTAKNLNPSLYVIARSAGPFSDEKLRLAGADRVVSPYAISGRRMVISALQPMMTDFIDTLVAGRQGDLLLAELEITAGSPLEGSTLTECFSKAPSTKVLGVRHAEGALVVGPKGDEQLLAGDIVIVLAEEGEIARLAGRRNEGGPAAR
jgi:voltage-gated potassium channel